MKHINISHIAIDDNRDMPRRQREREAVSRLLAAINPDYRLAHRHDGSPFIEDHPEITLSITHSTTTAAVAITTLPDTLLGIDLESPRAALASTYDRWSNPADVIPSTDAPMPRIPEVSMSRCPDASKSQSNEAPNLHQLLKLWTAKEAAYKARAPHNPDRQIYLPDIAVDLVLSTATLPDGTILTLSFQSLPPDQILAIATTKQ